MINNRFPKHLHQPVRIANKIELEDLAVGFVVYVLGYLTVWQVWVLGLFAIIKYMKIKKNKPRGFLNHWVLRLGLKKIRGYPPLIQKRFIE